MTPADAGRGERDVFESKFDLHRVGQPGDRGSGHG